MGGAILGMTPISLVQYMITVVLGALSLVVAALTKKFIPLGPFERLSRAVDLETDEPTDKLSRFYMNARSDIAKRSHTYMEEVGEDDDGRAAGVGGADGPSAQAYGEEGALEPLDGADGEAMIDAVTGGVTDLPPEQQ